LELELDVRLLQQHEKFLEQEHAQRHEKF